MPQEVESERRLLSTSQTARYLGVTERTLYNLVARGGIRPVKLPGIVRTLFAREDVEALVEAGKK